ncbi:cytochrome b5-related protein-like [Uranotaenia lowii]|uniref:cytochrome b5-related protein-like n=1 Tax=Uranotaenia lowii TaxID=190385 RepID=UPI0024788FD8|nr:cytochrome b5-related protein-like [Uranotaenia lowii]XP_055596169.1 cytochrome b5-related protein-like [Uranotaenia lowii]XP_055596170.1 cytochrome b5-related protein-like [Uranotaenia lowii]
MVNLTSRHSESSSIGTRKLLRPSNPGSDSEPQTITSLTRKYPDFQRRTLKTVNRWLDSKRLDDGAEGLWRVHDTLYDLESFAGQHPGGAEWIRLTKGTDITEAFETHHISARPEQWLAKFKVRPAQSPRNIRLTFAENGFYRTLKKRVRQKLSTIDTKPARRSKLIFDTLLASSFTLAVMAINFSSYGLATLSGLFIAWTMICSHNFLHRRDNWRMLMLNLTFFSYREWRVSHALSHHMFPNSILDLEISFFEPFLCWLPRSSRKNVLQRFGSWFYGPFIYMAMSISEFIKRFTETASTGKNYFHVDDLITLLLPSAMYVFSFESLVAVLNMWLFIVMIASLCFGAIGLNAAHHHPDIVHWGDRIPPEVDFGVYQMAAIIDRSDVKGSQFKALTSFGDHSLHHLFPTLDHGILPALYPVFLETCREFEVQYREISWWQMIIGQHQQLARVEQKSLIREAISQISN